MAAAEASGREKPARGRPGTGAGPIEDAIGDVGATITPSGETAPGSGFVITTSREESSVLVPDVAVDWRGSVAGEAGSVADATGGDGSRRRNPSKPAPASSAEAAGQIRTAAKVVR